MPSRYDANESVRNVNRYNETYQATGASQRRAEGSKPKPKKVTAKDMPGSGTAKKAAKAIEGRRKSIEDRLKKAQGY